MFMFEYEVPGKTPRVCTVQHTRLYTQKFPVGTCSNVVPVPVPAPAYVSKGIPVPRVLCLGHTELVEVSGMGVNVVHNSRQVCYGSFRGKYPGSGCVRTLLNTPMNACMFVFSTMFLDVVNFILCFTFPYACMHLFGTLRVFSSTSFVAPAGTRYIIFICTLRRIAGECGAVLCGVYAGVSPELQ